LKAGVKVARMIVFRADFSPNLELVDQSSIIPEITILDLELFEGGKLIFEIFTGHFTLFTGQLSFLQDIYPFYRTK
jgi:hypothetical protein